MFTFSTPQSCWCIDLCVCVCVYWCQWNSVYQPSNVPQWENMHSHWRCHFLSFFPPSPGGRFSPLIDGAQPRTRLRREARFPEMAAIRTSQAECLSKALTKPYQRAGNESDFSRLLASVLKYLCGSLETRATPPTPWKWGHRHVGMGWLTFLGFP